VYSEIDSCPKTPIVSGWTETGLHKARMLRAWGATFQVAIFTLILATPSFSHDAPDGWKYPFSCCSGYDCRPVESGMVLEENGGFTIRTTGEFIPYTDIRVKPSLDDHIHWCSKDGKDDGATICIFVPPKSF